MTKPPSKRAKEPTLAPKVGDGLPKKSSRLRRLSEEEIDLWLGVAASITRRAGSTLPDRLAQPEPVAAVPVLAVAVEVLPPPRRAAGPAPLAPIERKLKQKLTRGKITADAAIDLHGFRKAEAFAALRTFLYRAHRDGARVVLVVTGKGGRTTNEFAIAGSGMGVLKRSVPLWLAMPELRDLVLGYEEAGPSHGGSGALYVRLRRRSRA